MSITDEKQKKHVAQIMTLLLKDVSPAVIMGAAEEILEQARPEASADTDLQNSNNRKD